MGSLISFDFASHWNFSKAAVLLHQHKVKKLIQYLPIRQW